MDYNITYREKDGGIQAIVSYKDSLGKWRQKSKQGFAKKGDAKTWAQNMVDDLKDKIVYTSNSELARTTFSQLRNSFIEHIKIYRTLGTAKNYDMAVKKFSKLDNITIEDITSLDIQDCVNEMVKSGLKSSTIKGYTSKIQTIFDYAVNPHKIIRENPVKSITLPSDKSHKNEKVKALTEAELRDILYKIKLKKPEHYYLITLIAATCGLRIGEICGLTWDDINENESTFSVNKQWKIIKYKPVTYGFGPVKSRNSNRTIPIPPTTLSAIKKYKKVHPTDINNRIFIYKNTGLMGMLLRRAYKLIGYDISIHTMRHTYVSKLVANGLDFKTIAELIGDTVETTIRTYSHFTSDMMTRATNLINSIF